VKEREEGIEEAETRKEEREIKQYKTERCGLSGDWLLLRDSFFVFFCFSFVRVQWSSEKGRGDLPAGLSSLPLSPSLLA
jgi:hypothetical protein